MEINTSLRRCILCLANPINSFEHIIPQAIGGKLSAFILCTKCNNSLGSKLVNNIKEDPSIRLALQILKNKIPRLVQSMEEGQLYLGRDKNGNLIRYVLKNSKYIVMEGKSKDGSIIKDTKNIKPYITKKLKKEKIPKKLIEEKISLFEQAKNDEIILISNNTKIVKREIEEFTPMLDGSFINMRAIALMAYEYLALLIGGLIYDKNFNEIREYILNGIESKKVIVKRFIQKDRKYVTYHKIFPEFYKEKISITISFFGFIIFKVDFYVQIPKPIDYVFIQDLEDGRILFANSLQDAKQNKFFTLK